MLGTEFTRTVRAAQAGDAQAFTRLWRDANPVLVRYLRVVGHDDPYDGACEGWVTVLRGLPTFRGDEAAWWLWLLRCARMRAQEGTLRRAWGSAPAPGRGRASVDPAGGAVDPLDLDDLYPAGEEATPRQRGLTDSLAALRGLPLGQGEVLLLRLGAKLSVRDTGQVVGSDEATVRRLEERGLERLAVDRDLLAWSLDAPASPAELADERVVLGRYRALPVTGRRGTRTVAVGGTGAVEGGRRGRGATAGAGAARHSRAAAVAIAATSASVVSLGGLTAAAYAGALPEPVQEALHRAIGAPAPGERPGEQPSAPTGTGPTSPVAGRTGSGPDATAAAAVGLCRAWGEDGADGVGRDRSTAFRALAGAAGGAGKVDAYCANVLANAPRTNAPNPSSTKSPAATKTKAPKPSSTGSPAATNAPRSPTGSKAADPTGAASEASRTSGPRTSAPRASPAKGSTPTGSGAKATGAGATGTRSTGR